jgi:hypothetical protein
MSLELRADPRSVTASRAGDSISLRARTGGQVRLSVRVSTTGRTLTPLKREEIFTPAFLSFLRAVQDSGRAGGTASIRARWLEREVRGVELLVSREKLMSGLPTYATYFGRYMLVSALMLRSIWRSEMSEFAVASALRKLSPTGQVSHEEALGGQAVREGAAEYARVVDRHLEAARQGNRAAADSLLDHATVVLRDLRRTRENYHMIDDEFQLAVLAGRWLADSAVPAARKRAFLTDSSDGGGTRLVRLLRELGLVTRMTAAYAADPIATNLVSFEPADSGRWSPASWRDSGAGYGGGLGRYAMDVNAIWAPHALESIGRIVAAITSLGVSLDTLATAVPDLAPNAALGRYTGNPTALNQAVDRWYGASQHCRQARAGQSGRRCLRAWQPCRRTSGVTGERARRDEGRPGFTRVSCARGRHARSAHRRRQHRPGNAALRRRARDRHRWIRRRSRRHCATSGCSCVRIRSACSSTASGLWWRTTHTRRRPSGARSTAIGITALTSYGAERSTYSCSARRSTCPRCRPRRRAARRGGQRTRASFATRSRRFGVPWSRRASGASCGATRRAATRS